MLAPAILFDLTYAGESRVTGRNAAIRIDIREASVYVAIVPCLHSDKNQTSAAVSMVPICADA
jgi:hypothetical protein